MSNTSRNQGDNMTPTVTTQTHETRMQQYPVPTVNQLLERLRIAQKKSANRKATLKSINKSHMLLTRMHDELKDAYFDLQDDYERVIEENRQMRAEINNRSILVRIKRFFV